MRKSNYTQKFKDSTIKFCIDNSDKSISSIAKSSGSSIKSKPKISKAGSKLYRGTIFMSALSAIRFNPKITQFYNRLKDNGKQSTLAQVAVMRKLIIIAHSLYKNNQEYIY